MNLSSDSPTEQVQQFPVSVILERRPATSQWIDHVWSAVGVTVGQHAAGSEPQLIREDQGVAHFLIGGFTVSLHVDECESYYYNLVSESPRVFVVAHTGDDNDRPQPFLVSMSFDEAHAYLEGDDDIYSVDMPAELYRWTEAFVIANYFPEQKKKRKLVDWSATENGTGHS